MKRIQKAAVIAGLGFAMGIGLFAGLRAIGQDMRLPGAVDQPPAHLLEKPEAPFDIKGFFQDPAPGRNAESAVLRALTEFGGESANYLPASPDRDRRIQEQRDRDQRFVAFFERWGKDRDSVTVQEMESIAREYADGFRMLVEAQRRPECVFHTGINIYSLIPHAQTARMVARIVDIRADLALRRGDVKSALDDAAVALRMSRDLQTRGFLISQLVSAAIDSVILNDVIKPVLESSKLTVADCDRAIAMLNEHKTFSARRIDQGMKAEYLMNRQFLWSAIRDQDGLRKAMSIEKDKSILTVMNKLAGNEASGSLGLANENEALAMEKKLAAMSDDEFRQAIMHINQAYQPIFDKANRPYSEQIAAIAKLVETPPAPTLVNGDVQTLLRNLSLIVMPSVGQFLASENRAQAGVSAYIALAALKRWNLAHPRNGAPAPDLATACKAAKLDQAPVDPFDGKPIRMIKPTGNEGSYGVYSIGKDGRDDQGKVDSEADRKPGDLIYRIDGKPMKSK